MLSSHQPHPSPAPLGAAKYVLRYLKGTKDKGIVFSSRPNPHLEAFNTFKYKPNQLIGLSDANWGPQDSSPPNSKSAPTVPLHTSRSQLGFVLFLFGPIAWVSTRNKTTSRSSCEAEIFATDECVKVFQNIKHILEDLDMKELINMPTPIYNDNTGCIAWSNTVTNRNLRHIQMRENVIRENIVLKYIQILHCDGKENIADIFTKEDKDKQHFLMLRDALVQDPLQISQFNKQRIKPRTEETADTVSFHHD